MSGRISQISGLAILLACGLLAGCSSASGGGDSSKPNKTYIVVPNGQEAPPPAR